MNQTSPMTCVRKALVLAAGLGTRLRPLTWRTPKPLLPLWGAPLLAHTLRRLEAWGVTEIFINTHWLPGAIQSFAGQWRGNARITLSHEPEILGTGGALRPLAGQLGPDPFWLVNGDIAFSLDPAPLLRAFNARPCVASAWLKPDAGPCTVETDPSGRVTSWHSPRGPGTATLAGIHLVSPEIFRFLPGGKNAFPILEPYQLADRAGLPVLGVVIEPSFWSDIGTPQSHLQTHAETLRRGVQNQPGGEYHAPLDSVASFDGGQGRPMVVEAGQPRAVASFPAPEASAFDWAHAVFVHLGARGSNREFWRAANPAASAIVIRSSGGRAENSRYAPLARALRAAGVPVPRVLHEARQPGGAGLLLLQDLGDHSLLCHARGPAHGDARPPNEGVRPSVLDAYLQILNELHRFHATASGLPLDLEPAFDAALYDWEQNLFAEHLLLRRGRPGLPPRARAEYARVAARLLASPGAVIHRDLQSTNLLLHENRWHFIDFQGMRRGAIAYDLASLLCDPYAGLPAPERETLLHHHASLHGPEIRGRLVEDFHWAVVQRLTQAMGAFGRLAALGHAEFQGHLVPAARLLVESARRCGLHAIAETVAGVAGGHE